MGYKEPADSTRGVSGLPPRVLTQPLRQQLVDAVLRIPAADSFEGRTAFLLGLPASLSRNAPNARADLDAVFVQLDGLGRLDSGQWPLLAVIDNILSYAQGYEVYGIIYQVRQGLEEAYCGHPTPPPDAQDLSASLSALHTLPPSVADFTGRTADIEKLLNHLRAVGDGTGRAGPVAGIRGMGGIGKTQLALAVAQQLQEEHPDQILINLQTGDARLAPDAVLGRVIHAFQPDLKLPVDLEELQHTCRSLLANRRFLLLLDNALDAAQVKLLLPPPAGWAIIVTSRARFPLAGGCMHDVDLLLLDEATGLLGRMLSEGGREDVTGENLAPLAEACGRLPLALRLAAGYLTSYANRTLASYLAALGKARLKYLAAPDEEEPLRAVLGLSVDRLRETNAQAAQQWHDLAVFSAPFDASAAAAVWEAAEDEAEELLGRLVQRSLVEHEAGTYRVHDLLREVALEAPLSDAVRHRHAGHYLQRASEADDQFLTAGSHIIGLQQLDLFLPHLLHAWQWLKDQNDTAALQWLSGFPDQTANVLDLRIRPADKIALLERAAEAASALGDRRGEGAHLNNLGSAYADLGQAERAIEYYEQALAISREIGDRCGEGADLGNLGLVYGDLGQVEREIEYHEQALAIAREIGDRRGEGADLGNLGLAYYRLGQVDRAIEYHEQALAISREIGNRRGEGIRLGSLGLAYWDLGQVERAIEYYEPALAISREIGDRRGQGAWLGNLGLAYAALGQAGRAIETYEQALAISREIGDRRNEGAWLGSLGLAYAIQGQATRAIESYEQALAISREIGDRQNEGIHSWNLGLHYQKAGDLRQAAELMQVLVDYEREAGHAAVEAHAEQVAAIRKRLRKPWWRRI